MECERIVGEKSSGERRFFISSLDGRDAEFMGRAVRSHWRVKNSLHLALDVSFAEDSRRVRQGHAAENFSRLRRIALDILKQTKQSK